MIVTQSKLISSSAQIQPGTILNTDIADDEITNAKINPINPKKLNKVYSKIEKSINS